MVVDRIIPAHHDVARSALNKVANQSVSWVHDSDIKLPKFIPILQKNLSSQSLTFGSW